MTTKRSGFFHRPSFSTHGLGSKTQGCGREVSALSSPDVDDLLAERGVKVSDEGIRGFFRRCGIQIAVKIRRDRPNAVSKLCLDGDVTLIRGRKHKIWRAV